MRKLMRVISVRLIFLLLVSFPVPVMASGLPFADVPENHEKYDAIKFVYDNGLMYGASETAFNPNGTLMRAMIVTVLWRHAGEPTGYPNPGFTDIQTTDYYYDAVCWAAELGITTGTTATTFDPYRTLTKQETLIFLYRYAHHEDCCDMTYLLPDPNVMSSRIGNSNYRYTIAPVAEDAVDWAVNCGILDDHLPYFNGDVYLSRAECAEYLYRFLVLGLDGTLVLTIDELKNWSGPENVQEQLENRFAPVYYFRDLYPVAMEFALYNNDIIYIRTHGTEQNGVNGNGIFTRDGCTLMKGDIQEDSMTNVDLVYVSACYAGDGFCGALHDKGGAPAVVGFLTVIWAVGNNEDFGGADYFDERFFYYYSVVGESLDMCLARAKVDIFQRYGRYLGTDSAYLYD